jgi:3-phosphoshikimate 1-carboxyvinyltransferase
MDKISFPAKISGTLRAPSSKSMAIRAVAGAMLSEGTSLIYHPSRCDDALAMLDIARQAGSKIKQSPGKWKITGDFRALQKSIRCGESGLAARLMIALAAHSEDEVEITGRGTLLNRHLGNIEEPLIRLGVKCQSTLGKLPFRIQGPLKGGTIEVCGSAGSQFISGLLMSLPLAGDDSRLLVSDPKSIPYLNMTLKMLERFGIEIQHQDHRVFNIPGNQKYIPASIEIEGDWSGAAFLLVAGALAGDIRITGLDLHSPQADRQIVSALQDAGVRVIQKETEIQVYQSKVSGFDFDATHCPDLFPPLAVLAAGAAGVSRISGVHRLDQKESDRGWVLQQELGKLGVQIALDGDVMRIQGGTLHGGVIFSHHDHRIAMAGSVAALIAESPVTIINAECVSKSYPAFFEDLKKLESAS